MLVHEKKENNMKKAFLATMLCVALVASVFANGAQESSAAAPASDEPITLTVFTSATTQNPEGPLATRYFQEFEAAHPNIKLEIQGVPNNQGLQKLTTLIAAGETPDLFCNSETWYGSLLEMGVMGDITPYLTKEQLDNIDPGVRKGCTTDGKLYQYPWYSSPNSLIYRADWFKEAGIEEPKTLDDMLQAAIKINKPEANRYGFGMMGTNDDSARTRFIMIMRSMGAREMYQDEKGVWQTEVGNDASIKAFQYFADLKNKYGVVPPGAIENSFNQNVNLFAQEQIGMLIGGSNTIGKVFNANPELKGKVASVEMPEGVTRYTPAGYIGWSINDAAPESHKKAAVELMVFINEKNRQIEWVETTGRIPCTNDALNESEYLRSDLMKGFVAGLQHSELVPDVGFYKEVRNELGKTYQKLLLDTDGKLDVAAEVKACAETIKKILKDNQ